jgi:hypothetical protein
VKDDWVLGELVKVWYRLDEDGGGGGHTGDLARADGLEDGKKWIRILADGKELKTISFHVSRVAGGVANLGIALRDYAGRVVPL